MTQYKVLKSYTDKQLGKVLQPEEVIELTDERAAFVIETLEKFGGGFLQKVESQKKSRKVKEAVEEEVAEDPTTEETEE